MAAAEGPVPDAMVLHSLNPHFLLMTHHTDQPQFGFCCGYVPHFMKYYCRNSFTKKKNQRRWLYITANKLFRNLSGYWSTIIWSFPLKRERIWRISLVSWKDYIFNKTNWKRHQTNLRWPELLLEYPKSIKIPSLSKSRVMPHCKIFFLIGTRIC